MTNILDPVTNFAISEISAIDIDDITANLESGKGALFPAPATDGAFNGIIFNSTDYKSPSDDPSKEIVRVTGRSTDALTFTRAQEGTSVATHNTAGKVYKIILAYTKKMRDDIETRLSGSNSIISNETPSGALDGSDTTYTLANTPITGTVKVYLNGQRLTYTEDYTVATNVITFVVPPIPTDLVRADYELAGTVSGNADTLDNHHWTDVFPIAGGTLTGTATLVTGTTTVAPIKFVAGTNLTTPVAGVVEFDGTDFYISV